MDKKEYNKSYYQMHRCKLLARQHVNNYKNVGQRMARVRYQQIKDKYPNAIMPQYGPDVFEAIYLEAHLRTKREGIRYDVDHIFALKNGGKHAPSNVQIISKKDHVIKTRSEIDRHKLTPAERKKVRYLYCAGNATYKQLAKQFDVSTTTIYRTVRRISRQSTL